MDKVYVTQEELDALDDSIELHKEKQKVLDSGEKSYVWCLCVDFQCCVHAGVLTVGANCNNCAIGKAGYKNCSGIGWNVAMEKDEHQRLLDKLIEIRECCVVSEVENVKVV